MSLRPRYSLLTLLVLTALVAGGVKLWYGPHHVVEIWGPDILQEYSYTLDWRGNRIEDGPYIRRFNSQNRNYVTINYFRNGEELDWLYGCRVVPMDTNPMWSYEPIRHTDDPFSPQERELFQQAIQREQERISAANKKCHNECEVNSNDAWKIFRR